MEAVEDEGLGLCANFWQASQTDAGNKGLSAPVLDPRCNVRLRSPSNIWNPRAL